MYNTETKIIALARSAGDIDRSATISVTRDGVEVCTLQTFANLIQLGWRVAIEHPYGVDAYKHVVLYREVQHDAVDTSAATPATSGDMDDPLIEIIDQCIARLREHGLPTPRTCGALVPQNKRYELYIGLTRQLSAAGLLTVPYKEAPASSPLIDLCYAIAKAWEYNWHPGLSSPGSDRIRQLADAILTNPNVGLNHKRYLFLRSNIAKTPDDHDNWHGFSGLTGVAFDQVVDQSILHYGKNDASEN